MYQFANVSKPDQWTPNNCDCSANKGAEFLKLWVMPARGRSKRILRKNIFDFSGKLIIAWSIEAAIKGEGFDRIIITTDDK